ncbi:MAG: glycosyltransferase family 2 protein [Candidatus Korobacteraceae bacterium]|jgi:glycosyltransferase involved in cell wall biosynthesis
MPDPAVSLIVASMERVAELERLLASLDGQAFEHFEVVIVDQNPDDRLAGTLARHPKLNLVHLRCRPGASLARNIGLRAAKGEIVGFPDDDCWYPENVLKTVTEWFASHPEFDGLFGVLRDENNRLTGPQWPSSPCVCTRETLWRTGITPTAFLTRRGADSIGRFDERLGPGVASGYHSGEDLDYFLRGIEHGLQMWHDPELVVHHPSFHDPARIRQKAYTYAKGGGYILRAQGYPLRLLFKMLLRSAGGALVSLLRMDWASARAYLLRAAGLLRGYILGPYDVGKASPQCREYDSTAMPVSSNDSSSGLRP